LHLHQAAFDESQPGRKGKRRLLEERPQLGIALRPEIKQMILGESLLASLRFDFTARENGVQRPPLDRLDDPTRLGMAVEQRLGPQ
jgi:hypothetical protein